jgi:hypothetical protein
MKKIAMIVAVAFVALTYMCTKVDYDTPHIDKDKRDAIMDSVEKAWQDMLERSKEQKDSVKKDTIPIGVEDWGERDVTKYIS